MLLRRQHFAHAFNFALPIALLLAIVPLQLLVASNHIVNSTNAMMKHIAIYSVHIFIISLVRTERGLALSNRYDASSTINTRLPIAHLLFIIPDELMRALLGIVNAGQAVMINVAKLRISKVAIDSQRALKRTVYNSRRRR